MIFTTKVHKDFHIIWLSNMLALSVPDEDYLRKALFSRNKKYLRFYFVLLAPIVWQLELHLLTIRQPVFIQLYLWVHGGDRTVDWVTYTNAMRAHHHERCVVDNHPWWGVFDTTSCNILCLWISADLCFSFLTLRFPPLIQMTTTI